MAASHANIVAVIHATHATYRVVQMSRELKTCITYLDSKAVHAEALHRDGRTLEECLRLVAVHIEGCGAAVSTLEVLLAGVIRP